ncbi:MAG TPA: DNA polymerase III subunit beta [Spirochaetales bacterium]|nr:DNA polymerase III subunit beta [Spirochaetales bacterium]
MKFVCEKNAFAREVSFAQEIIASKNALSVMSNVLLDAGSDGLAIKATDIKVAFETRIPVEVSDSGAATVFCDKLTGILASIPEGDIELEADDTKAVVKPTFKRVRFQLKTIASDKFPELPAIDEAAYFSVPAREFKDMIAQTVFAVSDDETRYFMNGVFLERTEDGLAMVATDGRRLAYIRKRLEASIPEFKGVIVPPKILHLIQKRASDEGLISLAVTEKNLFVKFGSYRISSVLIEGQFPNYQKVIPDSQKHTLTVKRSDLVDALKRVSIFVEQKSRRTFLELSGGSIAIASEESELGAAREEIPCRYSEEDVTIALNYRYIEDPLKVMTCEDVSIEFSEPTRAITLRPEPASDYFHIVMPMVLE